ncbi:MAG TPA: immunoglobulin domain-containing protein [Blastocatellia bacterium]|nr:immunoglobulin domain-containing protein [Blastocatellia bacterium]
MSFTLPPGTPAGTYTAQIKANPSTGAIASGPGSEVALAVSNCAAPSISAQPASATACAGQAVTFSVAADGKAPLSYQWRKNGSNITGASSSSYTIDTIAMSHAASYDVVVSNACGSVTSAPATLTVDTAPSITSQRSPWAYP